MENNLAFTEEDRDDLRKLYLHPLNFPDFRTDETVRGVISLNIGVFIFIVFTCSLIALLGNVIFGVIVLGLDISQFILFIVRYNNKRNRGKKKINEMIDLWFDHISKADYQADRICADGNQYLYKDWKQIVFYKHLCFAFSDEHSILVSLRIQGKDEITKFCSQYPEVKITEETEPFQIKKYTLNDNYIFWT
ncbi:MAG: hypothetical protein PHW34_03920 [Hespellia sp.]|nr:hypothetical protein [Hespellia sp.]